MALSKVVVGLDGSPDAVAALEYAVAEARLRNAGLRVVVAYSFPEYSALGRPFPVLITREQMETDIVTAVRPMIDDALAADRGTPPVEIVILPGSASAVLTECAEGAEMLVLGHRGRGAVASTVLGSVGLRCVLRARCPVTIVRAAYRREEVRASTPAAVPARRAATVTS